MFSTPFASYVSGTDFWALTREARDGGNSSRGSRQKWKFM